jgi:hypothetical protein
MALLAGNDYATGRGPPRFEASWDMAQEAHVQQMETSNVVVTT